VVQDMSGAQSSIGQPRSAKIAWFKT